MFHEIRDSDIATRWLAAGLCLQRLTASPADEIPSTSRAAFKLLSESGAIPPAGVLSDVARLLAGHTLEVKQELPAAAPELRQAIRHYEDQFLGRLAADPRLDAIADAIAKLPPSRAADAVPLMVGRLMERMGYTGGVSMSPGVARRATEQVSRELLEQGYATLREAGELTDWMVTGYEQLVAAARRTGALLSEADVFLLENLDVLDSLTQRLAIEQMVEVADELGRTLPRRLKPRNQSQRGRTPTQIEDEDQYPIGGFASISTSGSLENLVSSELIYMDETPGESVDLFDLRYVEGELLYYTRDESVFVRTRRQLTFVILPELSRARFKDQGLSWQRLVIVFGVIACTVRRLSDWLSEEGLSFRVVFVHDGSRTTPLKAEKGLCELLLREWIEKEMCTVDEADALEDVLFQAAEAARTAQSDVVAFTMDEPPALELDPRVRLATISVQNPTPVLRWHDRNVREVPTEDEPWSSWRTATLDLLQEVI